MGKKLVLIALSSGVVLTFGCTHARSTVPLPSGQIQPDRNHIRTSPEGPPTHFTVLHSFSGGADGGGPWGNLIRDGDGNLYGTTVAGGPFNTGCCGVVFKLDPSGNETVLFSFDKVNGAFPHAGLVRDAAGNFYGTTFDGGPLGNPQLGVVFELDVSGHETVLHSFGGADGSRPQAGLVRDAAGNLYGTASIGGSSNFGAAFMLDAAGNYSLLHNFTGTDGNGRYPYSDLIRDSSGNLYGTTMRGGAIRRHGAVFKVDRNGNETVLFRFNGADGAYPEGGLVQDAAGNLYGTTSSGGANNYCERGCGVVFKLDPTGKETVLHSFGYQDGEGPSADLIRDGAGNLYGTTAGGGAPRYRLGVVFMLDARGHETVLHTFNGNDGESPEAGLVSDAAGNLFGTTYLGGSFGKGVVFELSHE